MRLITHTSTDNYLTFDRIAYIKTFVVKKVFILTTDHIFIMIQRVQNTPINALIITEEKLRV